MCRKYIFLHSGPLTNCLYSFYTCLLALKSLEIIYSSKLFIILNTIKPSHCLFKGFSPSVFHRTSELCPVNTIIWIRNRSKPLEIGERFICCRIPSLSFHLVNIVVNCLLSWIWDCHLYILMESMFGRKTGTKYSELCGDSPQMAG